MLATGLEASGVLTGGVVCHQRVIHYSGHVLYNLLLYMDLLFRVSRRSFRQKGGRRILSPE